MITLAPTSYPKFTLEGDRLKLPIRTTHRIVLKIEASLN